MKLWMSRPFHSVAASATECSDARGDGLASLVHSAYGRSQGYQQVWAPVPMMAEPVEEFTRPLAIAAANEAGGPRFVRTMFDCRSGTHHSGPAPSYALADICGLGGASPVAFGGRGGAEVAAALFMMMLKSCVDLPAVVCASQRVLPPDARSPLSGGVLADAAAAVAVGASATSVHAAFCVLGAAIAAEPVNSCSTLVNSVVRDASLNVSDLRWFIRAPASTEVDLLTSAGVQEIVRRKWIREDFGSADILVSLSSALEAGSLPHGPGVLVHRGWFGALGAVLLEDAT